MEYHINRKEEQFFIDSFNVDNIFRAVDRVDFIYLYYIIHEHKDDGSKVYVSTLANDLKHPMPLISKGMERLQDEGLIHWEIDRTMGKTYVVPTDKAIDGLKQQRTNFRTIYSRLQESFSDEDLEKVSMIMKEARNIAKEVNAAARG